MEIFGIPIGLGGCPTHRQFQTHLAYSVEVRHRIHDPAVENDDVVGLELAAAAQEDSYQREEGSHCERISSIHGVVCIDGRKPECTSSD